MALVVLAQPGSPIRDRPVLAAVMRLERSRTVVVLEGEADAFTRGVLSDVLSRVIASRLGEVVIDLDGLRFIDSASVRLFAITRRSLDREGRKLSFRSPSALVNHVLQMWGLAGLIESPKAEQL
jgi:anti-anti-sigma factor